MLSSDRVTTFAASTSTVRTTMTTAPLPVPEAGAQVDLRGTLGAVHFRDERGFAIFSLEQPDGTRIRALGDLPADVTLRAVVRIGGIWIRHAQYGWQVRVSTSSSSITSTGAESSPSWLPTLPTWDPSARRRPSS